MAWIIMRLDAGARACGSDVWLPCAPIIYACACSNLTHARRRSSAFDLRSGVDSVYFLLCFRFI